MPFGSAHGETINSDWLTCLLEMAPVTARLDVRCVLGAPWRLEYPALGHGQMQYHIILTGSLVIEDPFSGPAQKLVAGDVILLPEGPTHVLYDGSGLDRGMAINCSAAGIAYMENDGGGERVDILCGRFMVPSLHERLLRRYLPSSLIVRASEDGATTEPTGTSSALAALLRLMRLESAAENLGGHAILNALSTSLFPLILRLTSEAPEAPTGFLAVGGDPRLAPALSALFNEVGRPWSLDKLADGCNMSRATFIRQFGEKMGRSANELLTEIRMLTAADQLRRSGSSTGTIAEAVGYKSEGAFQRAFKRQIGVTPSQWRRGDADTD